ncbi:hypothetical protein XENOCAPTIV_030291 [Xenoophorus captivus]|uniref:Uncharacterized protein n=1 Tax=Xenoophorus captivus TaxID=1517983 RepID=A0ABV0QXC0_9TELE
MQTVRDRSVLVTHPENIFQSQAVCNFAEEIPWAVTNYLFPIWTYSYLAFLFPVFLLTDFLKYKPVIVVQGLFLVSNYILLSFAPGLPAMTFLQVRVDYFYLNAITLGVVCIAFLVSFLLPMPKKSMFFKGEKAVGSQSQDEGSFKNNRQRDSEMDQNGESLDEEKMAHDGSAGWHLVYWSLWWALATAGYMQIFNYIQLKWDHIEPSATSSIYNGGVEAVSSVVGAAAAFSVSLIRVTWAMWGELALGLFSAVCSGAVYLMAFTSSIWACYAAYVIFKSCYMFLITITT